MRTVVPEAAVTPEIDLAGLPRARLVAMAEAAAEVMDIHRVLAKTGDNIVGAILNGQGRFYEWDHYPRGDVFDSETHSQFYYHAHAANARFPGEHGHFHTFLRPGGMPDALAPAAVPDFVPPRDPDDALSHLIAISMDGNGRPFRLFTVNRWVTGEVWYTAEDVIAMLDSFAIDHAKPSWPVNRWITAMLRLFRPQIVDLVRQRDSVVAAWQRRHPARNVFEDRQLEVTSYLDVAIDDHVAAISRALDAAG